MRRGFRRRGADSVRLVPQAEQNRESSGLTRPQLGQTPGGGLGGVGGGIVIDSPAAGEPPEPPW